MLLLIVAPLILVSIVHPVRLVGINADGLMLLLIVAPPTPTSIVIPLGPTGIGIDPSMTFPNNNGRPMYVLDDRDPISDLL